MNEPGCLPAGRWRISFVLVKRIPVRDGPSRISSDAAAILGLARTFAAWASPQAPAAVSVDGGVTAGRLER